MTPWVLHFREVCLNSLNFFFFFESDNLGVNSLSQKRWAYAPSHLLTIGLSYRLRLPSESLVTSKLVMLVQDENALFGSRPFLLCALFRVQAG